ncbi:MAG: phosphatidate cytidylyltransferase [Thermodesulfobacterium sp.]|nr:phosphatidate cytidylyltransferase [Thermodesulfobacterium sp.]
MNLKRFITALILFPLLVLVLLKADFLIISLLILLTAFLCFYEWKNLYEFSSFFWIFGEALLLIAFLLVFKYNMPLLFIFYFFLFFSFLPHLFIYEKELFKKNFPPFLAGLIYIFLGLYPFWEILQHFEREYLIYFFSVVFANDTGAYLTGKAFGKTPFFSNISPRKTWEGFFGGIVLSLIVAITLNYYLELVESKINIVISLLLAIAGCIGDLLESAFKRAVNKKDSGKIIVGHGGILDRLDSVLLASPLFLIILKILKTF